MREWLWIGFLMTAAIQDFRKKQVDIWVYLVFGALGAVWVGYRMIWYGEMYQFFDHATSCSLGFGLLGVSMMSRGEIGCGDGCFFLVSGILLGFWENLLLLLWGSLCCGLFCLVLIAGDMVRQKKACRRSVPFLPFVALPGLLMTAGHMGFLGIM